MESYTKRRTSVITGQVIMKLKKHNLAEIDSLGFSGASKDVAFIQDWSMKQIIKSNRTMTEECNNSVWYDEQTNLYLHIFLYLLLRVLENWDMRRYPQFMSSHTHVKVVLSKSDENDDKKLKSS